MDNNFDKIIFGKKKFSDLLKEIYDNQKNKATQIFSLISELKPLVETIGDATLLVPLIKEYLEIGVKNDEQLVKLAQIVQKLIQSSDNGNKDGLEILSEKEKAELYEMAKKLNEKDPNQNNE